MAVVVVVVVVVTPVARDAGGTAAQGALSRRKPERARLKGRWLSPR
jgi:hypothetical protein